MDKRKYMKPTCEAVAVNTSQSLLTIGSLTSLSTTTHTARMVNMALYVRGTM